MMDIIEDLINEYAPTVIVVAIIVCTYLYMNRPPPPPPKKPAMAKPVAKKPDTPTFKSNEKSLKIFFGTQTRTAEDFSRVLEKEAKNIGIPVDVVDMSAYDPEDLHSEYFVMFIVATHGEGDPTDNAKEFYLWLTSEERQPSMLNNVPFTVFGLGNKTYEHYNAVARVIDNRMEELGGKRVYARGEGDDDATLEEDFIHWKKNMWPFVCEFLGYQLKSAEDDKFVPRFNLINVDAEGKDLSNPYKRVVPPRIKPKLDKDGKTVLYDIKNPYLATVVENRELHGAASDRSCRHVELDISGTSLVYTPGDHLGVYPTNDSELVEALIKRLGVDGDQLVALVPHDKAGNIVEASFGPMSIRKALHETDITNPPRKNIIRTLADYTQDEEEKKRLVHLASEEGTDEYNNFIKHEFRSIVDLLVHFPGVQPPIAHFLELLPRIPARYYSISSSLAATPGRVTITSVVVNFVNGAKRYHNGVCSTWLSKLTPGSKVPIFVRESHFRLPPYFNGNQIKKSITNSTSLTKCPPMIMIGPGTGLAPFRGFLQEIKHKIQQKSVEVAEAADQPTINTKLYFGCRRDDVDYLYKDEVEQYKSEGIISDLSVAFSRATDKKVYVQNKLMEDSKSIWEALQQGAYIYVCGDARNMAKSVQQTLLQIIRENGGCDENASQSYIEDLSKTGRYLQDVWF